jgi:hypothetical protein
MSRSDQICQFLAVIQHFKFILLVAAFLNIDNDKSISKGFHHPQTGSDTILTDSDWQRELISVFQIPTGQQDSPISRTDAN